MRLEQTLVSHPLGNEFVRALLELLFEKGELQRFYTSVALSSGGQKWLDQLGLPISLRSELRRRAFELPSEKIRSSPFRELARQLATRARCTSLTFHESGWCSPDAVYRAMDHFVAKHLPREKGVSTVYAYEDAALETFRAAHRLGLKCGYEITIGHYASARQILQEEAETTPEFASTIEGLRDSAAKLARKDEELALADVVVACSDFVKETLLSAGCPTSKIVVVQYGAPELAANLPSRVRAPAGPLRLLFAGRVGQRKGIGYLLQAMRLLGRKDVQLTVVGEMVGEPSVWEPYRPYFEYRRSCPHAELLQLMADSEMLVLPTLFEGQALVILEAMKSGLPVMTTKNSGASNLIREGEEGFFVPIRSVEALIEKIHWAADHRQELAQMGLKARERADQFSWNGYATSIQEALHR